MAAPIGLFGGLSSALREQLVAVSWGKLLGGGGAGVVGLAGFVEGG